MNTIESVTTSRLVSLARLNLAEATAWALHAQANAVLPLEIAREAEDLRFLITVLDDTVAEGGSVSDQEALIVLQRACILYGRTLGLSKA